VSFLDPSYRNLSRTSPDVPFKDGAFSLGKEHSPSTLLMSRNFLTLFGRPFFIPMKLTYNQAQPRLKWAFNHRQFILICLNRTRVISSATYSFITKVLIDKKVHPPLGYRHASKTPLLVALG